MCREWVGSGWSLQSVQRAMMSMLPEDAEMCVCVEMHGRAAVRGAGLAGARVGVQWQMGRENGRDNPQQHQTRHCGHLRQG